MKTGKPHIRLFRTPGGSYIYDVNTDQILKIDADLYDDLAADNEKSATTMEAVKQLKEAGYLQDFRPDEIVHPLDQMLEDFLDNRLPQLTLQVTQSCNFRCSYCAYSGAYENRKHENKSMSFETAKKGIDFMFNHSRDSEVIAFGFYGGEPLLEFELLKRCVEYIESFEGRDIHFTLTTNGTLLDDEKIRFFQAHNFDLLISMDGPKEVHDKNRIFAGNGCGTFEKVITAIEKIKKDYPEYEKKISFSVVIDGQNSFSCINEFFTNFETVKDLQKLYSYISTTYTDNPTPFDREFILNREYERFKLFLSKLNRLDKKYVSAIVEQDYERNKTTFIKQRRAKMKLGERMHHGGPCVPGGQRLFMDVNGNLFPCERVSESSRAMHIGHIDTGFEIEQCRKLLNVGKLTENACADCWAIRYCYICGAFADDLEDLNAEIKSKECNNARINVEENFKDFCMLREFGADFKENEFLMNMEI